MIDCINDSCKSLSKIDIIQINLKHSKLASANLIAKMIEENLHIALIQEPWVHNEKVKGLNHRDYLLFYRVETGGRPRSCILIHRSLTGFLLSNFSDADTTVIKLEGIENSITIISAYFDGEGYIPNPKLVELMEDIMINKTKANTLIGCDANARSELWGSSCENERGELLLEFINQYHLIICNRGNTPTFTFPPGEQTPGWSDVIDVTLCNNLDKFNVKEWLVREENSFSDHNYITFSVDFKYYLPSKKRNPRNAINSIMNSIKI